MLARLLGAVAGLVVLTSASYSATMYTDPSAFGSAVGGLSMSWSEDFENFSSGTISGALSIGDGSAEIFTPGTSAQEIYSQSETGNQAYWNVEEPGNPTYLGPETTISGLSASAFSFGYNMGGVGSGIYEVDFITSTGVLTTTLFETSVSYPDGENGEDIPLFIGWIGDPGEVLSQVVIKPRATGILIDNIASYAVVPLPHALPLLATALVGMGLLGWRRKKSTS